MDQTPPSNWGADGLSKFIDLAQHNSFASFVNFRAQYQRLEDINQFYHTVIDYLTNTPELVAGLFLLRSHSAFLGAARLSLSGQIPEAFMVLRACLENGLYGLYISRRPTSAEIWLRRHESDSAKSRVRREFSGPNLWRVLENENRNIYETANGLYERTIDYGAHPNERALMTTLNLQHGPEAVSFEVNYLIDDVPNLLMCLKTDAQVGVCTLDIFRCVFKERFDLLGLTEKLSRLKKGL
jgi:hypothetical protein